MLAHHGVVGPLVVKHAVLVEPDFGQTNRVAPNRMQLPRAALPLVRTARPEDVTHVTARVDLEASPTHPDLKG